MPTENSLHTVLIVDDNPDILKLLFAYLNFAGFKVYAAESGQSALEKAATVHPDIILLDVLMPNMDGFETCRRLSKSEKTRDIPVIFLTALSDTDSKIRGFKAGAVDYVTKPFQNEEIIARVTTHITLRKLQKNLEAQNQKLQEENLKRRRVQDALKESRERYRLLAENSTDIISRQTPDGVFRYVSPACRGLLGYEIEEMVGKRELDFVHPEDVPLVRSALDELEMGAARVTYTYRAIRKDGSNVWIETTNKAIRHQTGGISGIPLENIAVSRNVTERKEAEQALQQSHDLLEVRVQERTAELIRLNIALRRFVPHEFLQFLGKQSIVDVHLGDQVQRDMTILTADIRSFSTLSEKMSPQENFNFLNTYLGRVSPIIRQNDGFIDKYIGDAVMALFPDQAEDALQSAIAIKQEVVRFNTDMIKLGLLPIELGIGIHTGSLMLGTIGEEERLESTVISDSVNLAFRLEELTKIYGASIIISQHSLLSLTQPDKFRYRFLGRVRVKGKEEPVSVFEVFEGDPFETLQAKLETLADFEAGTLHYHNQEFTQAIDMFDKVLAINPTDRASQLYRSRAQRLADTNLPPDWDGIETLAQKF